MGWPLPDELTLLIFASLSVTDPLDALLDVCQLFRRVALDRSLRKYTLSLEALVKCWPDVVDKTGFRVKIREFSISSWMRVRDGVTHAVVEGLPSGRDVMHVLKTVEVALIANVERDSWNTSMKLWQHNAPETPCRVRELILHVQDKAGRGNPILLHVFPHLTHLVTNLDVGQTFPMHFPLPRLEKLVLRMPLKWNSIREFLTTQATTLRELSVNTEDPCKEFRQERWELLQNRLLVGPRNAWYRGLGPIVLPFCHTLTLHCMEQDELQNLLYGCKALRNLTFAPCFDLLTQDEALLFIRSLPHSLECLTLVDLNRECERTYISWVLVRFAENFDRMHEHIRELTLVVHPALRDAWLQTDIPFQTPIIHSPDCMTLHLSRMPIDKR